jgi:hypothetical protein
MSITVKWDDEGHTVLRMEFKAHWTIQELRTVGMDAIQLIRTAGHPVYMINDFSGSASVPIGVLWQARSLNQMRPPNWEAGITITTDGLARNLLDLFGLVYMGQRRKQLFVVRTNEEALQMVDRLKSEERTS